MVLIISHTFLNKGDKMLVRRITACSCCWFVLIFMTMVMRMVRMLIAMMMVTLTTGGRT